MILTLHSNGLVTCEPLTSEFQGLWPEVMQRALQRDDIEYKFGATPATKADVEFLIKNVCRDEALMGLCAKLISDYRKSGNVDVIGEIREHLRLKGRLI